MSKKESLELFLIHIRVVQPILSALVTNAYRGGQFPHVAESRE